MVDITDFESSKAWLEAQPRETKVAFAARCALRALPGIGTVDTATLGGIALPVLRSILTSGVAALGSTPEVRRASASASASASAANTAANTASASASAANTAANTASASASAANTAANTASASASAANTASASAAYTAAMWRTISTDADLLQQLTQAAHVFEEPAWPEKRLPRDLEAAHAALREFWDTDLRTWGFWRDWYDGMLAGCPMDWEIQKAVALIPDDIWKGGAARVAEEIRKIEAGFLARKLPQTEEIRFNAETGRLFAEPVPAQKPDLLAATLSQTQDALEDALAAPSNGLHDGSREVRVLRRTLSRYANDPQRIEMDFTSIHAGLLRQIAIDELPGSEENHALIEALANGARGIRGTDPNIAENRRILDETAIAELSEADNQALEDAQPILVAITEGYLSEDMADDIPEISAYEGRPSPYSHSADGWERVLDRNAKVRLFGRTGKIAVLLSKTPELVHKIDRSTGYSAAQIVATIAALVTIGIAIL